MYDIGIDIYYGSNFDNTCLYIVQSKNETLNGTVATGKTCLDDKKNGFKVLQLRFENEINWLQITKEELLQFAEEYYNKN